jgi:hypothetical protein
MRCIEPGHLPKKSIYGSFFIDTFRHDMLPDYPKTKALIRKRHDKHFSSTHSQAMGALREAGQARLYEGHRFAIIREDGTFDEMKWKKLQVKAVLKGDEIENLSEQEILAQFERMAVDMAHQQQAVAFEELSEGLDKIGNTVSGGITPETIFEVYGKMSLDFQDDGKHVPLTFSGSNEANIALTKALDSIHTDPELRRRFEAIIQRKRNEWRERESARKLVD